MQRLRTERQNFQEAEYLHQEKRKHYDAVMMGMDTYVFWREGLAALK